MPSFLGVHVPTTHIHDIDLVPELASITLWAACSQQIKGKGKAQSRTQSQEQLWEVLRQVLQPPLPRLVPIVLGVEISPNFHIVENNLKFKSAPRWGIVVALLHHPAALPPQWSPIQMMLVIAYQPLRSPFLRYHNHLLSLHLGSALINGEVHFHI